ncbi:tRNA pseudouridine(55) synthase TruB [Chitinimonas koreensis]|uniref:tRNA pseudouridine(55) synthase TruB n=1 Tax=Chitinimonas koreensis TaxID=356302 RepID=UPI00048DE0F7|nr:tRNA pseudouridine(55) synthase TruB [Chitinimonas koreensis]QNM97281.1 tRNA pseudouridine(55) synthase TruB [Chitinimonas koreensis]
MTVKRIKRPISGVLLLDKPLGISSNQALQKCRWLLSAQKGGHTGVLDPLATGLLPLCFGEATKFAQRMLDADKRYTATLRFGATTTTGDLEGEVLQTRPFTASRAEVEAAVARFVGEQLQTPPMYSALKHEGRPLYEYARAGITIERPARRITIYAIDILSFDGDVLALDVRCSKGSYIRTLAEDLGEALGCGAHLIGLRRTGTAGFDLTTAVTPEAFEALPLEARDALLLPADSLLADLPALTLDAAAADRLTHGMPVRLDGNDGIIAGLRLYGDTGGSPAFLGLGELRDQTLYPRRLLSTVVHN